MAKREILILPDQRLRLKSEPVGAIDKEIRALVEDMFETMYDAPGIGLAAIQIGFVLDDGALSFDPAAAAANGRGLREVGCSERFGPGYRETAGGRSSDEIRAALEAGEIEALILADVDPVREFDDPEGWKRALSAAKFTLSISMFAGASAQASDVHLPAEGHAEKEGTVTHPDGRLQRVRPSVPHPGAVRPIWQALSELSARLGDDPGAGSAGEVFDAVAADVPLYAGISVDDIGGMGLRWQDRNELALDAPPLPAGSAAAEAAGATGDGLRVGTYRDLWADYVAEENPALRFLAPVQTLELNPADAERLGFEHGQAVEVSGGGHSLLATVGLRERMLAGTAFLARGTAADPAGALAGAVTITVAPAPEPEPEPAAAGAEAGEEAPPALVVTKREPVSW